HLAEAAALLDDAHEILDFGVGIDRDADLAVQHYVHAVARVVDFEHALALEVGLFLHFLDHHAQVVRGNFRENRRALQDYDAIEKISHAPPVSRPFRLRARVARTRLARSLHDWRTIEVHPLRSQTPLRRAPYRSRLDGRSPQSRAGRAACPTRCSRYWSVLLSRARPGACL